MPCTPDTMQGLTGCLQALRGLTGLPSDIKFGRPDEIFGQKTVLANAEGKPGVKQGQLGDCYFLGTMAALALKSPELLINMFVYHNDQHGIYAIQMYHNRY